MIFLLWKIKIFYLLIFYLQDFLHFTKIKKVTDIICDFLEIELKLNFSEIIYLIIEIAKTLIMSSILSDMS